MQKLNTYNSCQRCNRKLSDPTAMYGWRCAEILGVAQNLNYVGDGTFSSFMVGVEKAYEFLARFNIPTDKLDIEAVYQSFIKYFLAKGMNDSLMKKEAYNALIATLTNDFAKTKTHILPKDLTSLKELLEQHDLNDLLHNNFSTTKFTDNEFNPYALLLQQKLNNGNATDKFGLSLKEDGIFGPNTQGANDGKKLELADITRTLARLLFGNPSNIDITKSGLYPEIFRAFGFVRTKDLNGNYIYHSTNDAFQQIGGYNEIYDIIFDYVTDMQDQEFEFSSGGVTYKLWAWKGDYLNLGAGAELGIYSKKSGLFGIIGVDSPIDDHWLVDTNLAMYTTMTVKYKGEEIINWDPKKDKKFGDDKVWWATSFDPSYTNVTADDLTTSFTVTFNSEEMFEDFYEAYSSEKGKPSKWTFDYVSKTATLTF